MLEFHQVYKPNYCEPIQITLCTHYGYNFDENNKALGFTDLAAIYFRVYKMECHAEWLAEQKEWGFHFGSDENGIDIDSQDGGGAINEDDTAVRAQILVAAVTAATPSAPSSSMAKLWKKMKGNGASEMNPIAMWNRTNRHPSPPLSNKHHA